MNEFSILADIFSSNDIDNIEEVKKEVEDIHFFLLQEFATLEMLRISTHYDIGRIRDESAQDIYFNLCRYSNINELRYISKLNINKAREILEEIEKYEFNFNKYSVKNNLEKNTIISTYEWIKYLNEKEW